MSRSSSTSSSGSVTSSRSTSGSMTTGAGMVPPSTMRPEPNTPLPTDFRLVLSARLEGDLLLGGDPFQIVRLSPRSLARIRAWIGGAPVGADGALARSLVMANLAQPIAPPGRWPVSVVIPNHGRDLTRLRAALETVTEGIVVAGPP